MRASEEPKACAWRRRRRQRRRPSPRPRHRRPGVRPPVAQVDRARRTVLDWEKREGNRGGGVTCGGGGRWRRERRLFGRTCDRRFCGSVVHFCLSLSLFLSPFFPALTEDDPPSSSTPAASKTVLTRNAAAAALTVRFGGFDSRIHFKKIESRNF